MAKIPKVTEEQWAKVNEENKEIASSFLNQLHLSPRTLEQYNSAIRIFFRWVHDYKKNAPLYKLKPRNGMDYQNYLIDLGLGNQTIRFKRSAVSSMCEYAINFFDDMEEYENFKNIFNKKIPQVSNTKSKVKEPLTKDEYSLLCKTLEEQEEWQMLAFLKFTYSSGCRKSEVHQIKKEIANHDFAIDSTGAVKPYYLTHDVRAKGKGRQGVVKKLKFDDEAMSAIKKWLEVRGEDDCEFLFVKKTKKGVATQLSKETFNYWASNKFSKIVGKEVFPHLVRSTRGTHLVVDEGKDINVAKELFGHASSVTTEIYVVRGESELVDNAF